MTEVGMVGLVHTNSPDLEHRTWTCRVTHINGEYITTTMGRFSALTRRAISPVAPAKLVLEGDEDFQERLDLAVTRGGHWKIYRHHGAPRRIRASLDKGVLPR